MYDRQKMRFFCVSGRRATSIPQHFPAVRRKDSLEILFTIFLQQTETSFIHNQINQAVWVCVLCWLCERIKKIYRMFFHMTRKCDCLVAWLVCVFFTVQWMIGGNAEWQVGKSSNEPSFSALTSTEAYFKKNLVLF